MPLHYVPWEEAPYTAANRKRRAAEAKAWEEKLAAAANSDQRQDPSIIFGAKSDTDKSRSSTGIKGFVSGLFRRKHEDKADVS
ncbi:hypothetical protein OIDMADRAFT_21393 [Oidiodendron maius Zn]|uniref:Uncharacterized protein n=1 Tax=Oidiodendron maius (strain Zn) TaxID=913774 RepID=A0A0C3GSQ2_OIDMZ|nr:hypothetical protein OIDMADRAFT_21393 [Oidiodendron maius Zn]